MFLGYDELVIFKNMEGDELLKCIARLIELKDDENAKNDIRTEAIDAFGKLIALSEEHGFNGNLWAVYLTNLLVNAENAYSLSCEIGGSADGSISDLMIHDMEIFYNLYHADIKGLLESLNLEYLLCVLDYSVIHSSKIYNLRIRDRICQLAMDMFEAPKPTQMKGVLTSFYRQYGVGMLGLHKAFIIEENEHGNVKIVPVQKMTEAALSDLVGYEIPKQKLVENTEAFINRKPANNCLLYGDAGTGKSTSVRALANEYYVSGLRIIQIHRHQFEHLSKLIATIKNRNYRFIIYMDDLSFEDFETEYKYLKAIIEGGLEQRPDNILIYATSNRRHLIKETVSDRDDRDEEMHRSDTMAEKLSLSQRFGVKIYFGSPDKKEFNEIVKSLALRNGITIPEEELLLEANKWELSNGGRSGRTAHQFIDHLLGMPSQSERSNS